MTKAEEDLAETRAALKALELAGASDAEVAVAESKVSSAEKVVAAASAAVEQSSDDGLNAEFKSNKTGVIIGVLVALLVLAVAENFAQLASAITSQMFFVFSDIEHNSP